MLVARRLVASVTLHNCTCHVENKTARSFTRLASSAAAATAATRPPPPFLYTSLASTRAIMPIAGTDSNKFLQGLVTNDVRHIGRGVYAFVLKADGRFLHDIFIYPAGEQVGQEPTSAFLIDHPAVSSASLHTYLKRHILRSKVKLTKPTIPATSHVMAAWRNPEATSAGDLQAWAEGVKWLETNVQGMRDTRAGLADNAQVVDGKGMGMGWRWVRALEDAEATLNPPPELFQSVSEAHYHLHSLAHAVPNGPRDFAASSLALEHNADRMGAVSYKKGCYVGQELTARTKHKGVVRKEGCVLRLWREGDDVPSSPLPSQTLSGVQPLPNLYPLPPPGSSLIPLPVATSDSASARSDSSDASRPARKPRAPRPAGKLGSSLPCLASPGGGLTLAYGVVRGEVLDAPAGQGTIFEIRPPAVEEGDDQVLAQAASEGESAAVPLRNGAENDGGDGEKWFAMAWRVGVTPHTEESA